MHVLLALCLAGLGSSTVYVSLAVWGALRFARRRRAWKPIDFAPAVSLLKPLHGFEEGLEQRLESFFQQQYPRFEILFCARSDGDPAMAVAMRVAARYPHVPARFLASGDPLFANAKVWSLEILQKAAQHQILVVSDSDVLVRPDYLCAVVAPFADPGTGMVTCLYRGVALPMGADNRRSLWSCLEAIGMSVDLSSGVLVAEMLAGINFGLGPTMVVRRECLDRAGGFTAIGEHHGDDFMLGRLIAGIGHKVVLSTHAIEHHVLNTSFLSSARHQIRWLRGTRFYRPRGHLGTVLTFSMPFALLAASAALVLHEQRFAGVLLVWGMTARVTLGAVVGRLVVHEPRYWRNALLYPVRDLMGFFLWSASYLGRKVVWREELFELLKDGRMHKQVNPLCSSMLVGGGTPSLHGHTWVGLIGESVPEPFPFPDTCLREK